MLPSLQLVRVFSPFLASPSASMACLGRLNHEAALATNTLVILLQVKLSMQRPDRKLHVALSHNNGDFDF